MIEENGVAFAHLAAWRRMSHAAPNRTLADRIDDLLPQTQCGQCGFGGCRPYAEALALGEVDINRCPPGGASGIQALATLLARPPRPLDPSCGVEKPFVVALIDESACIGCTKCIQACPVDAIVGAAKHMHTVIADLCTGCELCVTPCPVDCIALPERLCISRGATLRAGVSRCKDVARLRT